MTGEQRLRCRYPKALELVSSGEASPQLRRAVELCREGLVLREIAEELGVSVSRAGSLLADPLEHKARARKRRVYGHCADCGCRVYDGGAVPNQRRCQECERRHKRETARERIISAMRDWESRYGSPPAANDWNLGQLRDLQKRFHSETIAIAEARHEEWKWPHVSAVQSVFGSWNAAIAAAGFEPKKPGHRRNPRQWAEHMKGKRKPMRAADLLVKEIEKNKERRDRLTRQIAELEAEAQELEAAVKVVVSKKPSD